MTSRREELLQRWSDRVWRDRETGSATQHEIIDHVPQFLDDLARNLERLAVSADPAPQTSSSARAHGRQRFRIGFDVSTVVREYGDLRDVLFDMLEDEQRPVPVSEIRVLCQCITTAIAEAVTEHVELQKQQRLDDNQRLRHTSLALEEADRRKNEFLAILGHELRNPLAPIVTAIELMSMREPHIHAMERGVIDRQVKHMTRLVDDLLDISRITGGKIELRRSPIELGQVLSDSLEVAEPVLVERHQRIVVDVPPIGLRVNGDEVRLAQVVANLLVNAAKFSDPGGCITISGELDGGEAVLTITDQGRGIRAELLPHVFDLFTQGQRTPGQLGAGLGLGLTIAKSLTELHGGRISASSDGEDQGSEFVIRLPATSGPARRPTGEWRRAPAAGPARRRILVVDDNRDAADLLAEALREAGHQVTAVYDGLSAVARATELVPDIVLLDVGMPLMDGYEVARQLRSVAELATLRLAAVSGFGQTADLDRSAAAGFDIHFVKPVDVLLLRRWIEGQ